MALGSLHSEGRVCASHDINDEVVSSLKCAQDSHLCSLRYNANTPFFPLPGYAVSRPSIGVDAQSIFYKLVISDAQPHTHTNPFLTDIIGQISPC